MTDTTQDFNTQLIDELLKERKRDRRMGLVKSGLVTLVAVAYLGFAAMMTGLPFMAEAPAGDFAAVVKVSGEIGAGKEASYANLAPLLKKAFETSNAKGVVLLINSPGGTPVQASLIHDYIVELKTKHQKPVIAVGEDMLTSGAYLIAVAADTIVANRSTVAGSIGVISAGFGFTGLMEKLGIERRVATAGESKNLLDPFGPRTETDVVRQKALLEAIHAHFKDTVTQDRGERLNLETAGLFEGAVWTGDQAVAVGVIDELGNLQGAVKKHFGVDETVVLAPQKPMFSALLKGFSLSVSDALVQTLAPRGPQALYYTER